VVVALAAWPVPVRADGIDSANYTLKVPGGLPNPGPDVDHVTPGVSLPQLEATVIPAGGILPPTQSDGTQGSPLTILPDSFGFDKDKLVVALNNNPKVNPTDQKFGLVFFNGGLAADNLVHFSLSIDKALGSTPPTLHITDPATLAGIVLSADPTVIHTSGPADTSATSAPITATIPEPLSVLVWSAMAGFGLLRARGLRRWQPGAA
jgi:hypothetical protein